jgi:hypothetical protein
MKFAKKVFLLMILAIIIVPYTTHAYVLESYYWKNGVGNLTYKWGSNLQSPGTVIRNGFNSAVSDWVATSTQFGSHITVALRIL